MDSISLSEATGAWLEQERRIPVEVATRCGCVTVNGKLAFEYRKDGVLQYRKVRIETEDGKSFARDRKGAETCMFLEHVLQTDPDLSSPLVICEGEIDALSLVAAGIANVVSVPDGAQLDEIGKGKIVPEDDKAFGWLWDENGLKPHLAQFERIVIATDSDKKGRILREELAVRFERWRCDYVTYPEGCKDANEVLVKHGAAALAQTIEEARPIVPSRLVSFSEIPERGTGELFQSGFKGLDDGLKFAMVAPELMVITGEPGSGKSEFAAILGANLANYCELPGAILQFEDRTIRVRDTLTRYAVGNIPGIENTSDGREWVNKWFRTIEPEQNISDNVDYDIGWLTTTLREARVRHGCKWVIIDPWNEIEHIWDRSQNEASYTNDALRKLKRVSRALQIILIIVAHPSKEGGRQKEIADMDLYGISGAAAWANKADHGIIIHRPDKSKGEVYVKVAKSKDHILMGVPGIVRMKYLPASGQYKYIGMGV
jgi:twinkle protein